MSLKSLAIGLALGIKNAEKEMLMSYSSPISKQIVQQQRQGVLQDILDGKLTKQVQEHRYRHYLLLRKTDDKMRGKERRELYHLKLDPYDNYPAELGLRLKSTAASIYEDNPEKKYANIVLETPYGNNPIDKYCTKLVIRRVNDTHKLLELYIDKGQIQFGSSDYIIRELQKLINKPELTPLTTINKIGFVTDGNTYGWSSFFYFDFQILSLYKIVEYNNSIIIKYVCQPITWAEDILKNELYDVDEDTKIMSSQYFNMPRQLTREEELLLEVDKLKQENQRLREFI